MKTFKLFKLFSMHHRTAVCSLNVSSFISANVYLNFMATENRVIGSRCEFISTICLPETFSLRSSNLKKAINIQSKSDNYKRCN